MLARNAFYLAGYVFALWATFDGHIPPGMQRMVDYLIACTGFYAQRILQWQLWDSHLYTIPPAEWLYTR
jgi:hypothetical protein